MEAHEAYRAGNIDTALLKYAMLAELGYEVAQSNVAYILDHGKLVSFNRLETFEPFPYFKCLHCVTLCFRLHLANLWSLDLDGSWNTA